MQQKKTRTASILGYTSTDVSTAVATSAYGGSTEGFLTSISPLKYEAFHHPVVYFSVPEHWFCCIPIESIASIFSLNKSCHCAKGMVRNRCTTKDKALKREFDSSVSNSTAPGGKSQTIFLHIRFQHG
jgi:hypothetical protein